jgi:hypothetical protein
MNCGRCKEAEVERSFAICSRYFLLASLFLAIPVLAGAAEEIPSVPVDLSSSVFQKYLPFDADFLIVTSSDVGLQHVKVEYSDRQCWGCQQAYVAGKCASYPIGSACKKPALTEWRRNASTKADSPVQIQVPPLRARSRYIFTFYIERKPSDTEATIFKTRAKNKIDAFFREKAEIPDLRDEDISDLYVALNDAIVTNPNERIEKRLYAGKTANEIFRAFREELAGIVEAQDAKFNAVSGFSDLASDAEGKLSALLAPDSDLVQLVLGLQRKAVQDESTKSVLAGFQATLGFAANPPATAGLLVNGETELGAEPIASLWESNAVAARAANISSTLRTIGSLERLVDLVTRTPLLLQASGMTSTRLNNLGTNIRSTRFDLEAILSEAQEAAGALERRSTKIAEYVEGLQLRLLEEVVIAGSTDAEFKTQHSWYVAADLGVGVAPRINRVVPYVGTNIYFRPVNKSADLGDPRLEGSIFLRRFSMLLGATMQDINESGQREGLFANRGLILGAGLRLNRSIRISAGSLLFRELDPNPLVNSKHLGGTYFFSVSFDWDVRDSFAGFGKAVGLTE